MGLLQTALLETGLKPTFLNLTVELRFVTNFARPVLWCHKSWRVDSNAEKITTNNCV